MSKYNTCTSPQCIRMASQLHFVPVTEITPEGAQNSSQHLHVWEMIETD